MFALDHRGQGLSERLTDNPHQGYVGKFEDYVETSKKYFRPNEVDYLLGDPTKAQEGLNWTPKTTFQELVKMMVDYDTKLAKRERVLIDENLISPTWESPK